MSATPKLGTVKVPIQAWIIGDLAIHPSFSSPYCWEVTHRPTSRHLVTVHAGWSNMLKILTELARLPWPRRASEIMTFERTLPYELIQAASHGPVDRLREEVDAFLAGKRRDAAGYDVTLPPCPSCGGTTWGVSEVGSGEGQAIDSVVCSRCQLAIDPRSPLAQRVVLLAEPLIERQAAGEH